MTQDIELLNQIHQNADMGRDSVRHVIQLSNDVQFLHALNSQLDEYELAYEESAMARVSSTMKSLVNPTTSKLAEMVIQGNTMGATELKKQLNAYRGSNPSVVSLAQRQLKSEEKNMEDMKQYL